MNDSHSALRRRLNLSRFALDFPRATLVVWLAVVATGVVAAWHMSVALFPDIVFPVVVVAAQAPGEPAATVERELTVPLEARLLQLRDRGTISSTTTPGQVFVTVPFDVGSSLEAGERRVRRAVAGWPVPPGASLSIQRVDLNEAPIVTFAAALPAQLAARAPLAAQASQLASHLATVRGVAHVVRLGFDVPGVPVAPTRVRLNGVPALALEVVKRANANTLEVTRAVDRVVSSTDLGGGAHLVPTRAVAPFVREATGATLDALFLAVLLSVLVIFPFLRSVAATAISGLAIPTLLIGTSLVMALCGFKFETITLLALTLVVGIIVDDGIVDVENIVRHLPEAPDSWTAVRRATDEIGFTVTAAALTLVAVFVPVGLMGGVVGTFFRPFGLTISAAVLISLLVARTLTPVLAAHWLHGTAPVTTERWARFRDAYQRLLGRALARPWLVLGIATVCFLGALALIPFIPQGFIPALDRGQFDVHLTLPPGAGLAATDAATARIARLVAADPDVERVLSVAGTVTGDADSAQLKVDLRPDHIARTQVVEARLRARLAHELAIGISVEEVPIIAVAAQKPLEIILRGDEPRALGLAAARVLHEVASWPGLADAAIAGLGPEGDGTWLRRDGQPAAEIRANLTGTVALGNVSHRARSDLPALLPPDVDLDLGGESAQAAEVLGGFATALGLAVVGVLAVLLFLFRSWQDPLAIAAALPLSAFGALLGLFAAHSDFGIISLLALVFLIGLVNKNAILLVDRINQMRAAGLSRDAAILAAAPVRLRPIVMTTAAAVLSMCPLAFGFGAGAELRAPMAVAIIGGLLTSTLLSLIVVPVLYRLLDLVRPRFAERPDRRAPARRE